MLVDAGFGPGGDLRLEHPLAVCRRAHLLPHPPVVGDDLGDNIARTLQGLPDIGHLLSIDEGRGGLLRPAGCLLQDHLGQRCEPFFPGDAGAGAPFGAEGQVDLLELLEATCCGQGPLDLRRQFLAGGDELYDLAAALFEAAQIAKPLLQPPQLLFIELPGSLLAVTGYEGNGIPLIEEGGGATGLRLADLQLTGESVDNLCCGSLGQWINPFQ